MIPLHKKVTLAIFCLVFVLGQFFVFAAPQALAQTPPTDKKIDADKKIESDKKFDDLEKQVQSLKQAVDDLRKEIKPDANKAKPDGEKPAEKTDDPLARIRDEGLNRSQVMQTISYICNVIGPRLTGSPASERAHKWTADKMTSWGLVNAHLESYGPLAKGWTMKHFAIEVVEPQAILLDACPKPWSPGLEKPIVAEVVYLDAKNEADLDIYKGKLKGAVVLVGASRPVKAHFEADAKRRTDSDLLKMANAGETRSFRGGGRRPDAPSNPELSFEKKIDLPMQRRGRLGHHAEFARR